ncbi:MAG TPA: hypothetical protein VGO90_13075 [Chthoniobacteraceae bacterium]|jgi:hypothetical protein|nr:hypothetical protein [Chthoniobacteraceae bacterium]
MSAPGDEKLRRRMLGRLRKHLARRRSPRAVLSGILLLTALAGFVASLGMLKLGLGAMWLRYPLAVLLAWGVFLGMVRAWAQREQANLRAEELAELSSEEDEPETKPPRLTSLDPDRSAWEDWLDWMNPFNGLEDAEGCLVTVALGIALLALGGAFVAIAGLIIQAEVLLAELLFDVLLVSALNKRLHGLEPRWWLQGTLRQTVWPVMVTMLFLLCAGFLLEQMAPGAQTIGQVWEHWRGPR